MSDIGGLAEFSATTGTFHELEPPPNRDDFPDEASYEEAHHEWWCRMNLWQGTKGTET